MELDGVEGMMRKMKLSEMEKKGVNISWAAEKQSVVRDPQAIGKLFSEKPAMAEALGYALGRIWCPLNGLGCKDMGNNLFLFTFKQHSGYTRATEEGPWMFDKHLLVVRDFYATKSLGLVLMLYIS